MYFSDPVTIYKEQFVGALYPESFEGNREMIERIERDDELGIKVTEAGKRNLEMLKAASNDIFTENAMLIFYELK